jgi:hypothetical protein
MIVLIAQKLHHPGLSRRTKVKIFLVLDQDRMAGAKHQIHCYEWYSLLSTVAYISRFVGGVNDGHLLYFIDLFSLFRVETSGGVAANFLNVSPTEAFLKSSTR